MDAESFVLSILIFVIGLIYLAGGLVILSGGIDKKYIDYLRRRNNDTCVHLSLFSYCSIFLGSWFFIVYFYALLKDEHRKLSRNH